MSAAPNHASPSHDDSGHLHGHGHGQAMGTPHGSLREYMTGFVLSVVLTAIPFWLVMTGTLPSKQATTIIILGFALVQIIVHMVYFLHMNTRSEGGWNMLALIFTLVLVVIALSGSLWVMYHMNTNMMPLSAHEMRTRP